MDEDSEADLHPVALLNDSDDDELFCEEAQSSDSEAECHSLQPMQPVSNDIETDVPSPQDEDSIVGSGIADIPNDLETCLAMNKAYQDILLDALDKCYLLLEQNREMQATGPKLLAERSKAAQTRLPSACNTFLYPYFRDRCGMPAPPNEDEKIKRANNEACPYLRPPPRWTTEEIETLRHGVHNSLVERALESCMNRKQILAEKLIVKRDPELEERVREIESEMEEIKKLNVRELASKVNRPPDWLRISAVDFEGLRSDVSCELMWKHLLRPELNQKAWMPEEDARLKESAEKWQEHNWEEVAKELRSGRSAFQCAQRYHSKLVSRTQSGPFTKEEDELLLRLVDVCRDGDYIPWRQVAYYMEHRSRAQLICRWDRSLRPTIKRGKWTPEEDLILLSAVKLHGTSQWNKIGAALPNRPIAAIRERYIDHFKMDLVFGSFTPEEDRMLLDLVEKHGPKWSRIARDMSWRTDNAILIRYKKLAQVLNLESTDQIAEKKHNLPVTHGRRRALMTAESRRRELFSVVSQKILSRRQQQQARRMVLDEDLERSEYHALYRALLNQKDARITTRQKQRSKGRVLDASIARFLGVQTVVCPTQHWRVYEHEENGGILSVLRKMHDLPPREGQPESEPEALFAEYFQQKVLGWETEVPTFPPPVLPPNMTTTATYSHLLDRVKQMKIPEHIDHSELADALSKRSADAVLCSICKLRNEAHAGPARCLQCCRLRQIYEHYKVLRGHFLSYFLWPAILSGQPVEKPPPEQKGKPNRRKSDHLKIRKHQRKPWVAEKWKQHREAKQRAAAAAQAQASDPSRGQHQDSRDAAEQEDQDEAENQIRHDVQNNVDHEMCDEPNKEIEGDTCNEGSGDMQRGVEESVPAFGHAEISTVEAPMIIG
ncbi:snRNA-activating protein complex subunit 4-like isoform X2 [Ornithodoros turicata]|uniref:snRNA-activating protein complex subunit 4-like isoform X2 n=1 Tax=Ornithodoros turicata TaxID=34597 RepID=UPI00313A08E9